MMLTPDEDIMDVFQGIADLLGDRGDMEAVRRFDALLLAAQEPGLTGEAAQRMVAMLAIAFTAGRAWQLDRRTSPRRSSDTMPTLFYSMEAPGDLSHEELRQAYAGCQQSWQPVALSIDNDELFDSVKEAIDWLAKNTPAGGVARAVRAASGEQWGRTLWVVGSWPA